MLGLLLLHIIVLCSCQQTLPGSNNSPVTQSSSTVSSIATQLNSAQTSPSSSTSRPGSTARTVRGITSSPTVASRTTAATIPIFYPTLRPRVSSVNSSNGIVTLKIGLFFPNATSGLRTLFGFGQSAPAIQIAMGKIVSQHLLDGFNFTYARIYLSKISFP